jgi:ElaB/YqjD/DUF883 family membrane-anchored ribosome-binding protein
MDEPWRRWSDISQEDADAESFDLKKPVSVRRISDTDLERLAAEVGTIAGQAVALVRQVREKVGRREDWKGGISDLREAAKGRVQQLRRSAEEHAEEWRRLALEKTEELRQQTRTRYQQARGRAEQVGRDYPLQTVVAAGTAGFLLGIALRRRKAHHAR